jgi:Protein of unknown function (DUF3106)
MNSRHKGYIWGLLFSLPVFYTSQALAQHGQTISPEPTYQPIHHHSLKDANPWDGAMYGPEHGPGYWHETDVIWEIAENKHEYRHKRYEELSPEQRKKLRQRRDDFNALPQEEQERIHRARDKFRDMPPEKREKLKEKWRNMSPEERNRARKNRAYKHESHNNKDHKNRSHKDKPNKKKYRSYQ